MSVKVKSAGGAGGKSYDGNYLITPSTSDVIIPAKSLLTQDLVIQGDTDLVSSNIMSGKEIFGINGSAQGNSGTYAWKKSIQATVTAYTIYRLTINGNINTLTTEKIKKTGWNLSQLSFNNDIMTGKVRFPRLANSDGQLIEIKWASDVGSKGVDIITNGSALQVDANIYTSGDGLKCSTSRSVNGLYTGEFKYPTGTEQGLEFIEYVVSNDSSAYPNNATHTDGYYYTKIS